MAEFIEIPLHFSAVVTPVAEDGVEAVFAKIRESWLDNEVVEVIRANYDRHTARPEPIVEGRPRMLHVSAWIVHEGINNNRDVFLAEDLQAVVESGKLFQQPYGGVIDFNHDLTPIGYWYNAEYAKNPANGKHGILAHGAVWAWLYPNLTDKLIAEQVRAGKVDTSMMAMSKDTKMTIWEDNRYARIVQSPVFTGASLLDEPPADPSATGLIAEDPSEQTAEQRTEQLLAASLKPNKEDFKMDELKTLIAGLDEKIASTLIAAFEAKVDEVRAEISGHEQTIASLNERIEALTTEKAALQTSVDEKDLALSAAKDEATALNERVTTLQAQVDEFTAVEESRAKAELAQARLAELPDAVKQRFEVMPETKRDELLTVWASLDDAAWALRKDELSLGFTSQRLPNLPLGTTGGKMDLKRFLRSN